MKNIRISFNHNLQTCFKRTLFLTQEQCALLFQAKCNKSQKMAELKASLATLSYLYTNLEEAGGANLSQKSNKTFWVFYMGRPQAMLDIKWKIIPPTPSLNQQWSFSNAGKMLPLIFYP